MAKWKIKEKQSSKISLEFSSVIKELLEIRGFTNNDEVEKFLNPDYEKDVYNPFLFNDMEKVVERVKMAQGKKEIVNVYGDYDADGVTSSVILTETLTELEIENFVYIPDKKTEGYGLNKNAIKEIKERGASLIMTVDCGISNYLEVEYAKSLGMDVIVIDHHHVPEKLPDSVANINPQIEGSGYPFMELAGVGVAFKVVQALFIGLLPDKQYLTKWMLDLVCIGTVADCMPLIDENRIFVKYGLIVLSKTKRVGLIEMFNAARLHIDESNAADTRKISFQIAPRINAAGRMDHANTAFSLIKGENQAHARVLALELEASNTQRQKVTAYIVDKVEKIIEDKLSDKPYVIAEDASFLVGVSGLAAGRIASKYYKPTMIMTLEDEVSHASLRSIPLVNIIAVIEQFKEMLIKYGGHNQAAGLTVSNDKKDEFVKKLGEALEKELKGEDLTPVLDIDLVLETKDIDDELMQNLHKFEPFGQGNSQPVILVENLKVKNIRAVGNSDKHLKLILESSSQPGRIFDAIGFGVYEEFSDVNEGDIVDIVCNLEENTWNGTTQIQFHLIDLKVSNE